MMTFTLSEKDWQQAEEALLGKPSGTRFDKYPRDPKTNEKIRSNPRSQHAFIIINNIIYALSTRKSFKPEEGGASIVKQGITKDGLVVAIKIEDTPLKDEQSDAYQAGVTNGLIIGQGLRSEPKMKINHSIKGIIYTDKKLYTVMHWRGQSLISLIEVYPNTLTNTQRLLIAIRLWQQLEMLHEKGEVHADIKAENVLVQSIVGNKITLSLGDFDFAKKLEKGKTYVIADKPAGSPGFAAPELFKQRRYSFVSDCFAFAITALYQIDISLKNISYYYFNDYLIATHEALKKRTLRHPLLWLESKQVVLEPELRNIFKAMFETDPEKRIDASKLIHYICKQLEEAKDLEDELKQEIKQVKSQLELKFAKQNISLSSATPLAQPKAKVEPLSPKNPSPNSQDSPKLLSPQFEASKEKPVVKRKLIADKEDEVLPMEPENASSRKMKITH